MCSCLDLNPSRLRPSKPPEAPAWRAARWLGRRGRNREATMSASMALQHVVDRANLRASHLLTIHAARTNPLDLISGLGGYPLVVTSVERLAVDMSEAIDCWPKLRL